MLHPRAKAALTAIASLRLTVVLFALAMVLIFAGTLAQVHDGIWTVMGRYFRSLVVWIDFQLFVPRTLARVPGGFPMPGGFLLGGLMMLNLLAAHTVRFKWSAKRAGILTLHLGVIVLLLGELVTGLFAEEANMSIDEGQTTNYTENIRQVELAIIDPSSPDHDQVVVIPHAVLADRRDLIHHPLLPFDISVDQWMPNSRLFGPAMAPPGLPSKATAGSGVRLAAQPLPRVSGVQGQTVDAPSAYISLWHEGQSLGIWLVSLYLNQPQPVHIAGKHYLISLRFKRTYKPYSLHLIDFKHDKFVGTERPRNFSSLVRLVDPTRHEDRQVLIWMNHPLRYRGETFYQSSFKADDTGTVLQVVRNPGWLMPYVSCTLISVGMLIHFGSHLTRFLRRPNR